jgi:antitoxin component YwqK of YwqJK toxin-antitoxin module
MIQSCNESSLQHHLPATVNAKDSALKQGGEVLRWNGVPYSGVIFLLAEATNGEKSRDTIFTQTFQNGLADGWSYKRYDAKSLLEARHYVAGKRDGIHEGWWPNSKLRFRYRYVNDFMDGASEEWYESGLHYRTMNYSAGHEDGLQQVWNRDSSVFANYVVKEGRAYGNTGVMNCKNVLKGHDDEK